MLEPSPRRYQDLSLYRNPINFRGRPTWFVQLWWLVQASLFKWSPQGLYRWRVWLLRCFGAQVGQNCIIRPSVTVTYPWKVRLGNHVWIGDNAILYSLGPIEVGDHSVVSQGTHLCAGDHDHTHTTFEIRGRDIKIGSQCWVAADSFVAPGVCIGDGTVVGARSVVIRDLPAGKVCAGHPCRPIKDR